MQGNMVIESPLKFLLIELEINNDEFNGKIFVKILQLLELCLSPRKYWETDTE